MIFIPILAPPNPLNLAPGEWGTHKPCLVLIGFSLHLHLLYSPNNNNFHTLEVLQKKTKTLFCTL